MRLRFVVLVCSGIVLYLVTLMVAFTVMAKSPQPVNPATASFVAVSGKVVRGLQLSKADFARLPHRQVETKNRDGVPVT